MIRVLAYVPQTASDKVTAYVKQIDSCGMAPLPLQRSNITLLNSN